MADERKRGGQASAQKLPEVERFALFLGPLAQGYSQAQLEVLRQEMEAMAELLLDLYVAETEGQLATAIRSRATFDK